MSFWRPTKKASRLYDQPRRAIADWPLLKNAGEIIVYLHLAKTGGTSLTRSMDRSKFWHRIDYWHSTKVLSEVCPCGDPRCREHELRYDSEEDKLEESVEDARVFVTCGHVTFDESQHILQAVDPGQKRVRMIATVRPARARLVSCFRDYWEQVEYARAKDKRTLRKVFGLAFLDYRHLRRILDGYLGDANHYLKPNGEILGREWFTAFEKYHGGITFFLEQVFGTPERLASAIKNGELQVIPIVDLDNEIAELTGSISPRERVSGKLTPELAAAIDEASDIIDRMVERERPFDDVLREHLGDRYR